MGFSVGRSVIRPVLFPVLAFLLAAVFIIAIGEILLNLFEPGLGEFARKELWFGVVWGLLIIGVGALLAREPAGQKSALDADVVIGSKPMFTPTGAPVSELARTGGRGSVRDITEGYTLYARSGEIARVIGILPGSTEVGRTFKGYIYAEGTRGGAGELWIPVEAVLDVYPETHSAFLAIMGDETDAFGWNKAPLSFNRAQVIRELPKTL